MLGGEGRIRQAASAKLSGRRRRHFERDARFGSPRGIMAFSSSRMSIREVVEGVAHLGCVSILERGVASSAQYISRASASRRSFSLVIEGVSAAPGVGRSSVPP